MPGSDAGSVTSWAEAGHSPVIGHETAPGTAYAWLGPGAVNIAAGGGPARSFYRAAIAGARAAFCSASMSFPSVRRKCASGASDTMPLM